MFFVQNDAGALEETRLQVGDRIRIRPKLRKWFIWRPVVLGSSLVWFSVFRRFRRATRLWVPDGDGRYLQWLDLPWESDRGDHLQRLITKYGREHFRLQVLEWREEESSFAVDGRFDYVAKARSAS